MWFPRDELPKFPKPKDLAEGLLDIPEELGKAGKDFIGGLIKGPKDKGPPGATGFPFAKRAGDNRIRRDDAADFDNPNADSQQQ
ncbi:hypothetical protein PLICBS_008025 [Purpureocillium lilacinum]|uniref:uncharacterized protein n=1 Tax=Purpureocillium lilacinum TaxID=33203 RepID=UPI00207E02FA|nr:hypothetical protein PLICBS_008025 [Purpureocillium lilacinum]